MQALISVIVPIYNAAPYILRCLESIVAQSYQPIECLLIDDCGTDDSMQLVDQFITHYDGYIHFYIIHHEQNIGLSGARNTGMKAANGDYIYFLDSDDAITPNCIETLTNLAEKYPNADYVQGNIVTGAKQLMEGTIDPDIPEFCEEKQLLESIILCKTHRTAWNRLIKRSFLENNSLFFPVGLLMEDHYWTYFVSKHAHAVAFTYKGTYLYYNNDGSIVNSTSKTSLIKRYSSYIAIIDTIVSDILQRNDIQSCHIQYVGEAIVFCMVNLARLHSLRHWWIFWIFAWHLAYNLRKKITWTRFLFFICMMPPLCLITDMKGWRWRLRYYVVGKL